MSFNLKSLNPQQREAVETVDGPVLILAGAGSGKTRVITYRIAHLIRNKKVKPDKILAVTFTNKAAQEMKSRVQELLEKPAKGLVVSTFHSFGARILRNYIDHLGYKKNFNICSEAERLTLVKHALEALPGNRKMDPKVVTYLIGQAKNRQVEIPDYAEHEFPNFLNQIHTYYQERLKINNLVDFDDLLTLPLVLFREHPEVLESLRDRFRYFSVDEYQDTNKIQYELISALAKKSQNLCVVGDDDQSIYAWRGADESNIHTFENDWPSANVIKLEQNYRSTDIILKAANQVIRNNKKRQNKTLWTAIKGGAGISFFTGDTPDNEAEEVVTRIRQLQSREHAPLGDIAILYRRNAQARILENALRLSQIPYLLIGSTDFFERREIKDIFAYLSLISNPYDEIALSDAISVPRRGIGDQSLQKIRNLAIQSRRSMFELIQNKSEMKNILDGKAESVCKFAEIISDLHHRQVHMKPSETIRELVNKIDYRTYLEQISKDEKESARRKKVIDDLIVSLENYQKKMTNPTLQNYLERISLLSREDRQENATKGRITLMTLHAAKGLEFPYVFIVGMEEGIFPSSKSIEELKIDEERRLCYVGLTRAKKKLFLSATLERSKYGKVEKSNLSRFLNEIPDTYYVSPPTADGNSLEQEKLNREAAKAFFQKKKELLK